MRRLITLLFSFALLAGIASYAHWIEQRPGSHYLSDLRSQVAVSYTHLDVYKRQPSSATR